MQATATAVKLDFTATTGYDVIRLQQRILNKRKYRIKPCPNHKKARVYTALIFVLLGHGANRANLVLLSQDFIASLVWQFDY